MEMGRDSGTCTCKCQVFFLLRISMVTASFGPSLARSTLQRTGALLLRLAGRLDEAHPSWNTPCSSSSSSQQSVNDEANAKLSFFRDKISQQVMPKVESAFIKVLSGPPSKHPPLEVSIAPHEEAVKGFISCLGPQEGEEGQPDDPARSLGRLHILSVVLGRIESLPASLQHHLVEVAVPWLWEAVKANYLIFRTSSPVAARLYQTLVEALGCFLRFAASLDFKMMLVGGTVVRLSLASPRSPKSTYIFVVATLMLLCPL